MKFVEREIRRGNHYDAIIMDPPSYGRGPKGEIWKIEEKIFPLVQLCTKVLADKPLFFLINSYTTGLQPAVLSYMLNLEIKSRFGGTVEADEIGLPVRGSEDLFCRVAQAEDGTAKERVRGRGRSDETDSLCGFAFGFKHDDTFDKGKSKGAKGRITRFFLTG